MFGVPDHNKTSGRNQTTEVYGGPCTLCGTDSDDTRNRQFKLTRGGFIGAGSYRLQQSSFWVESCGDCDDAISAHSKRRVVTAVLLVLSLLGFWAPGLALHALVPDAPEPALLLVGFGTTPAIWGLCIGLALYSKKRLVSQWTPLARARVAQKIGFEGDHSWSTFSGPDIMKG